MDEGDGGVFERGCRDPQVEIAVAAVLLTEERVDSSATADTQVDVASCELIEEIDHRIGAHEMRVHADRSYGRDRPRPLQFDTPWFGVDIPPLTLADPTTAPPPADP